MDSTIHSRKPFLFWFVLFSQVIRSGRPWSSISLTDLCLFRTPVATPMYNHTRMRGRSQESTPLITLFNCQLTTTTIISIIDADTFHCKNKKARHVTSRYPILILVILSSSLSSSVLSVFPKANFTKKATTVTPAFLSSKNFLLKSFIYFVSTDCVFQPLEEQ